MFSENLIVFRKELLGVDAFFRLLETDPDRFENLDGLITHLSAAFKDMVRQSGLPAIIGSYVERKLKKVREYILARREDDAAS